MLRFSWVQEKSDLMVVTGYQEMKPLKILGKNPLQFKQIENLKPRKVK